MKALTTPIEINARSKCVSGTPIHQLDVSISPGYTLEVGNKSHREQPTALECFVLVT